MLLHLKYPENGLLTKYKYLDFNASTMVTLCRHKLSENYLCHSPSVQSTHKYAAVYTADLLALIKRFVLFSYAWWRRYQQIFNIFNFFFDRKI